MVRKCLQCKEELDEFEYSVYCEYCRGYTLKNRISHSGQSDYNYITDRNPKDSWDDQAPYSEDYNDQYCW